MERILVVEDEASIRKALQMGLSSGEFAVDLAGDGAAAIALGRQNPYDVLIADLCLPDINGIEVIEKIKHRLPEIIPIVITGKGDMQSSLKAIRVEVSDYLEKPLSLAGLKNAIDRGIARRKARRQAIEKELHQQALYDPLTGLANRILFLELLERSIARNRRAGNRAFAVLLVDIDRFKAVNDTHGHPAGDKALIEIAGRLKGCVGALDTVARLNGDEFAVLIEEYGCAEEVLAVARRCQEVIAEPIVAQPLCLNLTCSVGIVMGADRYESPGSILRDAEIALESSVDQGRGGAKVFDRRMLRHAVENLQLENDLQVGVLNRQFALNYQPIVSVSSRHIEGFEALIRWNHPTRGVICPDRFIGIAERSDLIHAIGEWVLREGCAQIARWKRKTPHFEALCLSVNISAKQLRKEGFSNFVAKAIHENGLNPRQLKLELTESVLMEDSERAIQVLRQLKSIGLRLSVDDFGTGYSSLAYLRRFPLDELKIDRSFVHKIGLDGECAEIVASIIDLAKKLGLEVVAEGVETQAQLEKLEALGCDRVQGFGFSKPLAPRDALELVERTPAPTYRRCLP